LPCGYTGDALPGIGKAVDLSKHAESSAIAVEQGATEQFRRARRPEVSFHGRRPALVARKGEHILNAQRFTYVLDLGIYAILINSAFKNHRDILRHEVRDSSKCENRFERERVMLCTPTWYGLGFPFRPSRTPFRTLWRLTSGSSPRWTPVSVKLLLPPRHSRGVSRSY